MTLPKVAWGRTPWKMDHGFILDADGHKVLDVRGYGRLTGKGSGALGLSDETASLLQDELGQHVIDLINKQAQAEKDGEHLKLVLVKTVKSVLKDKIVREKMREALSILKKAAIDIKDDGTGRAIQSIDEEAIIRRVLGK